MAYCSSDLRRNCASEENAKKVVNALALNTYYISEGSDFFDYNNLDKRPITADFKLLESVQFDADKRLSRNFLVSNNTVETLDNRWYLFEIEEDYNFLSFVSKSFTQFQSSLPVKEITENISTDIINFRQVKIKKLYSLDFSLSGEKFVHQRFL